MKDKDLVSTPHDRFFKQMLSDTANLHEFLALYVPKTIYDLIDIDSLKLAPKEMIDHKLRKCETDLLFEAKMSGKLTYFYLLMEHQSTPESAMPLRAARYISYIQEGHMKKYKTRKAPYVYPIIIYNGEAPYPYATDIQKMLDAPAEIAADYRLAKFQLVDLNTIDDEALREDTWLNLNLYAMKHAYDTENYHAMCDIVERLASLYFHTTVSNYLASQASLFCQ